MKVVFDERRKWFFDDIGFLMILVFDGSGF